MLKLGLSIAAVTLIIDQITKVVVIYLINLKDIGLIEVTDYFNLRMVWNRGVSFGMFPAESDQGRYMLIGFSLLVVSGLLIWLFRAKTRILAWAIGLIVGGAIGNVIDRFIHTAVADFLDFHAFGVHFYTFNVADTAITLGVILLIFESLFLSSDPASEKAQQES